MASAAAMWRLAARRPLLPAAPATATTAAATGTTGGRLPRAMATVAPSARFGRERPLGR